jgi:hypothetical protein
MRLDLDSPSNESVAIGLEASRECLGCPPLQCQPQWHGARCRGGGHGDRGRACCPGPRCDTQEHSGGHTGGQLCVPPLLFGQAPYQPPAAAADETSAGVMRGYCCRLPAASHLCCLTGSWMSQGRCGITAQELAKQCLYVSHETFTSCNGGCAGMEVRAAPPLLPPCALLPPASPPHLCCGLRWVR